LIEILRLNEKPLGVDLDPHNTLLDESTVTGI
jgi:hypothetical protein